MASLTELLHTTPSISGLAKVGNLFNRRAALPLARRTESYSIHSPQIPKLIHAAL